MSFFSNSSNITISGGSFNHVYGDQINNYIIQQMVMQKEKERTEYDEYTRVPTGKVYLVRKVCETTEADVKRTVHTARILGEDKDLEFLHLSYSGPGSQRASVFASFSIPLLILVSQGFKTDFQNSVALRERSAEMAQLFGYNDSRLPALIFYDALIPLRNILQVNRSSVFLQTYLSLRCDLDNLPRATRMGEIWMQPHTARLIKGPPGAPEDYNRFYVYNYSRLKHASASWQIPETALPIGQYDDQQLLQYLQISNVSKDTLLSYLATLFEESKTEIFQLISDEDALFWLEAFLSISSVSKRQVIFKCPSSIPDTAWKHSVNYNPYKLLEDGSFSFEITDALLNWGTEFCYSPGDEPWDVWNFINSWFAQADSYDPNWEDYTFISDLRLSLKPVAKLGHAKKPTTQPCYLIIRPIPKLGNSYRPDLLAWMRGGLHYYSFDADGKSIISDEEPGKTRLQIPEYYPVVTVRRSWWKADAYEGAKKLKLMEGTQVPDERRFEEVSDDC
ncbi:hypothetical protein VNI00_013272 [Paramarasmius palmivorus]|uniref:Uncharacterized protein n=1 Tax=Paramarasmius palmivorus TaxID=297713 RepID=A0AAW0BYJ0_9AGAR